nr:MCE family protein [Deltaproteobacteria bacterium]
MTVARGAAALALALVLGLAAWLLLARGGGTDYTLLFENAGQLVRGNDVQVGGRRIGSVEGIELTSENQAAIKVRVQEPYAPLREGTRATIRLTSLSGIANRYVALTPAPGDAKELADGATLTTASTSPVVDLDQIFNTLDAKTRGDLQDVVKGFATQFRGKGAEAGEATRYFNPLLSSSRRLIGELTEDEGSLTRFIVDSSRLVGALAEKRDDLSGLVGNANAAARAIGSENVALARALGLLPTTLRRANTTFVNLRATLDDLDVLVAESKPATKDLAPFLRELRPLLAASRPTIRDLRKLV